MIERHLHLVQECGHIPNAFGICGRVHGQTLSTRDEIQAWAAERRRVLAELVEREGFGRQLALDDERQAA